MNTRKNPQQRPQQHPQKQLARYFDELLTELDAPHIATDEEDNSVDDDVVSPKDVVLPRIATPKAENTVENHSTNSTAIPSSAKTFTSPPVQPLLQAITATSNESFPRVDLRQREKDKLERLLKTLTSTPQLVMDIPVVEVVSPVETAAPKVRETTEADVAPVTAKAEVDNIIETISDLAEDAVAPIELISASPHRSPDHYQRRWEPLAHEWQDNGRPAWAQNAFNVLLVDVNGVQLAMPLQALDAIYPLEKALTPLFGQAKWFMGLQKTIVGNVSIINTAQFVMPERYDKDKPNHIKYSVAINGSGWGLAVDNIHQPVLTNPDDIRWRVRRAERPWMAGTVKNHMCALIDIPYLARLLNSQNKNKKTIT